MTEASLIAPEAPAELPLDRLEQQICELAARQAAAECRLLVMIAEFDRREGWAGWGIRSCAHWLSWKCGLGVGAAREKVRVARRLAEMPLVQAAFAQGELSYSKVRALARAVTPATEELLLEYARYATTAQLEQIIRSYRSSSGEDELDQDRDRHDLRYAHWFWDDDGSLVLTARLGPEDGAALVAALEAERTALIAADAAEAPSPEPQMHNADALAAVARTALSARPEGHSALPAVVIHVDAAALPADGPGRCHIEGGPALPPETARRLACDASLVTISEDAFGNALDIGRRTQAIPPAIRRALWARDGGCRFPGCAAQRFVAGHHIIHWEHGGPTALVNLILLCGAHHRLVHESGYHLSTPAPNEFVFTQPDGSVIPAVPAPTPIQGEDQPTATMTSQTLENLAGRHEPFDLELTLDTIRQQAALAPSVPSLN